MPTKRRSKKNIRKSIRKRIRKSIRKSKRTAIHRRRIMRGGEKKQVLWFDLDDLLYSSLNGFSGATGKALGDTIKEDLNDGVMVSADEYDPYAVTYGISLGGLLANGKLIKKDGRTPMTIGDWQDAVIMKLNNAYDKLLKPDENLKNHLNDLKKEDCELFLFTNSDSANAAKILTKLRLDVIFPEKRRITYDKLNELKYKVDSILDKTQKDFNIKGDELLSKPDNELTEKAFSKRNDGKLLPEVLVVKPFEKAFDLALEYTNKEFPDVLFADIIFFDDNPNNIKTAVSKGIKSVYLRKKGKETLPPDVNFHEIDQADIRTLAKADIKNPGQPDIINSNVSEIGLFFDSLPEESGDSGKKQKTSLADKLNKLFAPDAAPAL